ncbi:hypothetical protein GP486_000483 [Trichoglossum hirsutum]|uniref:SHSP domain-containing protein n=1 Tax=Trichoglossum hirsutum TaxID=265104 RepID=A0A9P8LIH4_9PEZI|nr:hypothetical protein GP486_000483 [Trichoglossum hirsutum]
MSILPSFVNNDLGPLFRLLDDYDTHRSSAASKGRSTIRAFQPKFDVKETKNAYELYGELCGVEQDDVSVEFSDPHTIIIKGRVQRSPTTEGGSVIGEAKGQSYHKPTAVDETEDTGTATAVTKAKNENGTSSDGSKYWITERLVGEFHRSFSFPSRVDQDAVKASLKNGILAVVIPKAPAPQTRRIQIS